MAQPHVFLGAAAAAALLGIVSPAEALQESFIYSGGIYTIVNPPGSTDTSLASINDAGAVAGYITILNPPHG